MANVLFTRKNASEIPNVPITDGQLIFDTSGNGKMYLDNGTDRLEMGGALTVDATLSKTSTNPVQNKAVAGVMLDTLSDIGNVTSKGFLTDALAVKQLNTNVNELNNSLIANSNHFYFDYKNGKYGYNTNPNRGADTFHPFNSIVHGTFDAPAKGTPVTISGLGFEPKTVIIKPNIPDYPNALLLYNDGLYWAGFDTLVFKNSLYKLTVNNDGFTYTQNDFTSAQLGTIMDYYAFPEKVF